MKPIRPLSWKDVDCPRCGASPGDLCVVSKVEGRVTRQLYVPHNGRIDRAREMEALRATVERRQAASLWGKKHFVTPRLCFTVFGDGRKLIFLTPMSTRPNWYVIRIDSKWSLDNHESDDELLPPRDWTDDVIDALEEQFGTGEKLNGNGETYRDAWFPQVLHIDMGFSWGEEVWPKGLEPKPVEAALAR